MNATTTLTENGFLCPHCGRHIDKEKLDCGDVYDLQLHGDTYYECPWCGKGFFVDNCKEYEQEEKQGLKIARKDLEKFEK